MQAFFVSKAYLISLTTIWNHQPKADFINHYTCSEDAIKNGGKIAPQTNRE